MAYLFVHFKEKNTPDGEQVYFALSQDGFHWETFHDGNPVLTSSIGEQGVRDFTICRTNDGRYILIATDLSLARNFNTRYKGSWDQVSLHGSKNLILWESSDLLHWSAPRQIGFNQEPFGCLWAPDIIFDSKEGDYLLHWSSSHASNNYGPKKIYYSRTKDFLSFTSPLVLYEKEGSDIIDSAMYQENGHYFLFVKSDSAPNTIMMLEAGSITGPFNPVPAFAKEMEKLEQGQYEAPTAFRTEDGQWCLFLDFYGTVKEKQGYVPFIANQLAGGAFIRSDKAFSFPYGFKHGTVLTLTAAEYQLLKNADF